MASSSNPPCAACKFLRRKCESDCRFAAYFPPEQPQKFINVHKVFGASNVTKLLKELPPHHREDAVNSLSYEADMRLRDPVYGCVGVISLLQRQLRQLQTDLSFARLELSKYQMIGFSGHGGVTAASNQQQLDINLLGGGVATRHHDMMFPVNQQEVMRGFTHGGDGYDGSSLVAMDMSGQLNGFQPSRSQPADGRRMPVDPS